MKNKLTDFKKEKKQLKFTRTKELVLFLIMTFIAFMGFMIVVIYLILLLNKL
jgi:predicted MFS family arabinose efflux permease